MYLSDQQDASFEIKTDLGMACVEEENDDIKSVADLGGFKVSLKPPLKTCVPHLINKWMNGKYFTVI